MVLGLGCDTMATLVTRTLPTRRERVIATLLLALAIPCSAQLGVILGLLHGKPQALLVWGGQRSGLFAVVIRRLAVPLAWLGLPDAAAPAFLFGFFRRDYGAAG